MTGSSASDTGHCIFADGESAMRWPGVAGCEITVGGVPVSCAEAMEALEHLAAARSTAIRQILAARNSQLQGCDYWAVINGHRAAVPVPLARGTKQRHAPNAKDAFAAAIRAKVVQAAHRELDAAFAAFRSDERYAAAIAADAVAVRTREHAAAARTRVRAAIAAAVSRCARESRGTCQLTAACGTGQCPFAPEELRDCQVPAPPGRYARPDCHRGPGFSDSAAATWLAEARPWRPAVTAGDSDYATAADDVAA